VPGTPMARAELRDFCGSALPWASRNDVPVIASGGAGRLGDFAPAIGAGADAVLAASVFHYGELTIGDVKGELGAAGLEVRP